MVREKAEFDVLARIERERTRRNWTEYMLAKNSTWYRRQLQPSIASIEKICNGLGITLSEFFEDEKFVAGEESGESWKKRMTKEQRELYEGWERLTPSQREALIGLIKVLE